MRKQRSDKGKPRNSKVREARREARNLANTLADIEMLEAGGTLKPKKERVVRNRAERRKERRHENRQNELPANRMCERCGKGPFIKSKQFVKLFKKFICRKCFFSISSSIKQFQTVKKSFNSLEELENVYNVK